jgi:NADPH-dependent 2,4-dienoyl-CoA reductase/sulfur reductase-like enzyme
MSGAAEARRADPAREIVVLERGPDVSYAVCGIPYWIGGEVGGADDLVAHDPAYFRERRGIDVRTGAEAMAIDPEARTVRTVGGEEIGYDALLVATGARPVRPTVPGHRADDVLVLRDLESARALQARLERRDVRRAVLVGLGPIGVEMAEALRRRGIAVCVVEQTPRALALLAEPVAEPVLGALAEGGVEVRAGSSLEGIEAGPDGPVVRAEGRDLDCDLVLLGTGVAPRAELAAAAGCRLGPGGAIAVDRRGRTSVPGIWAAGDCATAWHRVLERDVWIPLATTANRQGRVAARDIAGRPVRFAGVLGSWVSACFGVGFGVTGLDEAAAAEAGFRPRALHRTGRDRSGYIPGARGVVVHLVWDEPTGRLLGAQAAGAEVSTRLHTLSVAIGAGLTVGELAGADLGYVPPLSPLRDPVELAAAAAVGDAP